MRVCVLGLTFVLVLLVPAMLLLAPELARSREAPTADAGPNMTTAAPTQPASVAIPEAAKHQLVEAYGKLPLSFEANQGQTDGQVKFLSRGGGYTLFLTANEAVLALEKGRSEVQGHKSEAKERPRTRGPSQGPAATAVLRMKLVGANLNPKMTGLGQLPGTSNYFIGNDPKQWRTNVPNFAKVQYESVYPGIDLVYYGNQRQLEYDFVVAPGADPKAIKLALAGADEIAVDGQGNLVISVEGGEVRFHKPAVYQLPPSAISGQSSVGAYEQQRTADDGQANHQSTIGNSSTAAMSSPASAKLLSR